jgi:hypothetical protein
MWLLLELCVITACFALGCRRRNIAVVFLIIVAGFLSMFGLIVRGNPIGLLASFGGWMILDSALLAAVVLSNALPQLSRRK